MARQRLIERIARDRGKPPKLLLAELYEQFGSQKEVAAALGIHQSTLSLTLTRLGLQEHTTLIERTEKAS